MWNFSSFIDRHCDGKDADAIAQCCDALQRDNIFNALPAAKCSIDRMEVKSGDEVLEYYAAGGERRDNWFLEMRDAIASIRRVCIIRICNRDRTGLEQFPGAAGRTATFFVDMDDLRVAYVLHDIFSEYPGHFE